MKISSIITGLYVIGFYLFLGTSTMILSLAALVGPLGLVDVVVSAKNSLSNYLTYFFQLVYQLILSQNLQTRSNESLMDFKPLDSDQTYYDNVLLFGSLAINTGMIIILVSAYYLYLCSPKV